MKLRRFLPKPKRLSSVLVIRRIVGDSMSPRLLQGDLVLATSLLSPRLGAVVIIRHNGVEKIKRVVDISPLGIDVRGDNTAASTDSRHFGRIAPSSVVAIVFWPRTKPVTED